MYITRQFFNLSYTYYSPSVTLLHRSAVLDCTYWKKLSMRWAFDNYCSRTVRYWNTCFLLSAIVDRLCFVRDAFVCMYPSLHSQLVCDRYYAHTLQAKIFISCDAASWILARGWRAGKVWWEGTRGHIASVKHLLIAIYWRCDRMLL